MIEVIRRSMVCNKTERSVDRDISRVAETWCGVDDNGEE